MKRLWKATAVICLLFCLILTGATSASAQDPFEEIVTVEETGGAHLRAAGVQKPGRKLLKAASGFSYGEQLESGNQTAIYQALCSAESMLSYRGKVSGDTNDPRLLIPLAEKVYFVTTVNSATYKQDPNYRALVLDFFRAANAYMKDDHELFWIRGFSLGLKAADLTNGYIAEIRVYPTDYYSGVRDEVAQTIAAVKEGASSINGTTRYSKVKAIHDSVCRLITYPKGVLDENCFHTLPSAWLENYGHRAVCEGYAKSFAYLCELNGIEAITVTGGTKASDGMVVATHMWNYVKMEDGLWYLVDCTWDDGSTLSYDYFLVGNEETSDNHIPIGCFTDNPEVQYQPFSYPELSMHAYAICVTEITAPEELALCVGNQVKLTDIAILPEEARLGMELEYISEDEEIAAVDCEGVVRGEKAGTTSVLIRSKEYPDVCATCKIEVMEHDYSILIDEKKQTCVEDGYQIQQCARSGCNSGNVETLPANDESHQAGDWKITKSATCISTGTSVRRCELCEKILEKKTIPKTTAKVKLNYTSLPLQRGFSTSALKIISKKSEDYVVSWTSSAPTIVSVNKRTGVLTGKKTGTAYITVKMKSGATAKCKITVRKKVLTKTLGTTKASVTLKVGKRYKILPVRTPITATDTITFRSGNTKIAAVSTAGSIRAKKAGTTKIYLSTASGVKAVVKLVVK